jgi:hypothetical protein
VLNGITERAKEGMRANFDSALEVLEGITSPID